MSNMLLFLS